MVTVLLSVVLVAAVAYALWRIPRGDDVVVDGAGNAHESYYGKDRFKSNPAKSPPCAKCVAKGCIGAGECRCGCHRPKQ